MRKLPKPTEQETKEGTPNGIFSDREWETHGRLHSAN